MSIEKVKRNFAGGDGKMMFGIAAIANSALSHAADFLKQDKSMTEDYFKDLINRIDQADHDILGHDKKKGTRSASETVKTTHASAGDDLWHFREFIFRNFAAGSARRKTLLDSLGFTGHYTGAVSGHDQNELHSLLVQLDQNLTPELETELVGLGMPEERIAALRGFAADFIKQKLAFKGEEGTKKELTDSDILTLNGLYTEIMGITRLGQHIFQGKRILTGEEFLEIVVVPGGF